MLGSVRRDVGYRAEATGAGVVMKIGGPPDEDPTRVAKGATFAHTPPRRCIVRPRVALISVTI